MQDLTALLYAESILKLLVRSGVLDGEDVLAMADEHVLIGSRQPHEAEARREVAHQLRCILFDLDPPAAVDPAVEHRAAFLRKQMVERTAMIGRADGDA